MKTKKTQSLRKKTNQFRNKGVSTVEEAAKSKWTWIEYVPTITIVINMVQRKTLLMVSISLITNMMTQTKITSHKTAQMLL